jgi:hypothetical protein
MWGGCIEFFIKYNINEVGVQLKMDPSEQIIQQDMGEVSNSNVINKGIKRDRMVNVVVDVTQV